MAGAAEGQWCMIPLRGEGLEPDALANEYRDLEVRNVESIIATEDEKCAWWKKRFTLEGEVAAFISRLRASLTPLSALLTPPLPPSFESVPLDDLFACVDGSRMTADFVPAVVCMAAVARLLVGRGSAEKRGAAAAAIMECGLTSEFDSQGLQNYVASFEGSHDGPGPPVSLFLENSQLVSMPWEQALISDAAECAAPAAVRGVNPFLLRSLCESLQPRPETLNAMRVFYLVNPSGDLKSCETAVALRYRELDGWCGHVGDLGGKDVRGEILQALANRDVYIYCGHQGGERYVHSDAVQRGFCEGDGHVTELRAVAILMGCASCGHQLAGAEGASAETVSHAFDYLIGGSPLVIGTSRSVTDVDLDRVTRAFLRRWRRGGAQWMECLAEGRKACKLPTLTGAACVGVGLPQMPAS